MDRALQCGDCVRLIATRHREYRIGETGIVRVVMHPLIGSGEMVYQVEMDKPRSVFHPTFCASELEAVE
jgi:hypothetical protein